MKTRIFNTALPLSALCLLPLTAQETPATPEAASIPAALSAEEIDTDAMVEASDLDTTGLDIEEISDGAPEDTETPTERAVGEVPALFRDDSMLDDSHANQELGVNVYTAPSISKIFDQLDGLPSIPDDYVLRKRPEQLPTDAGALSLELGFLLADGFIAVRSGRMNDIKPIALDLSRYGKALGVGERMNTHSATLLEYAEKGMLEQFKQTLAATQSDVNAELTQLKDPDLSHLIALGGWVRALNASAAAVESKYSPELVSSLCYDDAPAYFSEILEGINPQTGKKIKVEQLREHLNKLTELMIETAKEGASPQRLAAIQAEAAKLATLAVGKGYEH